jgi:hypothetical protein
MSVSWDWMPLFKERWTLSSFLIMAQLVGQTFCTAHGAYNTVQALTEIKGIHAAVGDRAAL